MVFCLAYLVFCLAYLVFCLAYLVFCLVYLRFWLPYLVFGGLFGEHHIFFGIIGVCDIFFFKFVLLFFEKTFLTAINFAFAVEKRYAGLKKVHHRGCGGCDNYQVWSLLMSDGYQQNLGMNMETTNR